MSDDVITNFLQSQPASKNDAHPIAIQGDKAQEADFKRVFSVEEEKISNVEVDDLNEMETEDETWIEEQALPVDNAGANLRQNNDQESQENGNGLPNLSLHHGALAVGRVIYTSNRDSVTPESLTKFITRQGLVVEGLSNSKKTVDRASDQAKQGLDVAPPVNSTVTDPEFSVVSSSGLDRSRSRNEMQSSLEMTKGSKTTNEPDTSSKINNPIIGQSSVIGFNTEVDFVTEKTEGAATNIGNTGPQSVVNIVGVGSEKALVSDSELKVKKPQSSAQLNPFLKPGYGMSETMSDAGVEEIQSDTESIPRGKKLDSLESLMGKKPVEGVGTERDVEIKKEHVHGQLHLQQFLGGVKDTLNMVRDAKKLNLSTQSDIVESAVKIYKDAGQSASQESPVADSGQQRLEFKGALREVQRLVATNVYNNLTDSYESWNARFGEVLANRIAGYINKENWNVQLKMNPASLGQISLEIDFSEKGLEGRFGANEESTRQLLQDTLPRLRLALREILEGGHGLKLDVGNFDHSNGQGRPEKRASADVIDEVNFETEVLAGRTLDPELSSMVGLDILV
ncbi:MAG: flagellar hook-length control protein FliK [Candidatus Azotimanducaceae bacterium]